MEQKIINYIFPIVTAEKLANGGLKYRNLKGTGFLIGSRNFCLTAAHVVKQCQEESGLITVALFNEGGEWKAYPLKALEEHTSEDIQLMQIENMKPKAAFISLSERPEYSSHEIMAWGYPIYVAQEVGYLKTQASDPDERPDLVYFKGYIRRRVSNELGFAGSKGKQFYEVDRALGNGVSGAPIFSFNSRDHGNWSCLGIYVAERGDGSVQHGFAVRSDAFFDWSPASLGRTVKEECKS